VTSGEGRPAWSSFREALETAGFRPSKKLGQNFLLDENMVRAIVRDARVSPGDRVLEVGPGCGFLTLHLAHAGLELTCVELDARLLLVARGLVPASANVRWIQGDVLAGKHALNPEVVRALPSAPWHVVSNLPYSVSAPFLACLCDLAAPPASITVLVQREVAERIAASPGSSDWGPLTIKLQGHYRTELGRSVSPALFWPRPAVESSIVRLELLPDRLPEGEREAMDRLVQHLFQHRRQGLARVLGEHWGDRARALAALERLDLDPRERAENLDLATLRALASQDRR
jgi:16S rRNA (adenine1518-N6/adenine1519-N6)-dimethyltransferase